MANTTIVPKHIAEAIVSPRTYAEPIERDALLSCLRYLRVTNPVGLVEAHWFDPSGSYPCIGSMMTAFGVPMTGVQGGITPTRRSRHLFKLALGRPGRGTPPVPDQPYRLIISH